MGIMEKMTGKSHGDKMSDYLKNAYEEGKSGAQETFDDFKHKFDSRYTDTERLAKSNKNEDKLKFNEALNKYSADAQEAKNNGKDKLAYYYEEAKNHLSSLTGK